MEVWLDSEVFTGSFLRTEVYRQSHSIALPRPVDLDWTIVQNTSIELNERSDTDAVHANITQGPLSRTELADSIRRAMGRSSLCHPQGYQYI